MDSDYFLHPERFPQNVVGPFYTLGAITKDGAWCGQCLACEVPELEAPTLLAPLTDTNTDTYFVRQPETDDEIEQACSAIEVCCVDALRYGGRDPKILMRLQNTQNCDYQMREDGSVAVAAFPSGGSSRSLAVSRRWWQFWR